jgi:hypothetical protein
MPKSTPQPSESGRTHRGSIRRRPRKIDNAKGAFMVAVESSTPLHLTTSSARRPLRRAERRLMRDGNDLHQAQSAKLFPSYCNDYLGIRRYGVVSRSRSARELLFNPASRPTRPSSPI